MVNTKSLRCCLNIFSNEEDITNWDIKKIINPQVTDICVQFWMIKKEHVDIVN